LTKIEQINDQIRLGMLDMDQFTYQNQGKEKRILEGLGSRFLLAEMLNPTGFEIVYDKYKKPYLRDSQFKISISHSHQWLVIAISCNEVVGVDIELVREKVERIKHKFATEQELVFAKNDHMKLTFLWAAKEAIYKAYGKKAVDFKDIRVDAFDVRSNIRTVGTLFLQNETRKYDLLLKPYDEYVLALTLHEFKN
jgi:4'-phosphopantetheinyl transferase